MLSGARALNGDHIYTLASVNANAAVIKGVLKQGKPEQLTATWSAVRSATALYVLHTFSEIGLERVYAWKGRMDSIDNGSEIFHSGSFTPDYGAARSKTAKTSFNLC